MAYVIITKDLTEVKDKVAFGLTKRQIICFTLAGVVGAGSYFLFRNTRLEKGSLDKDKYGFLEKENGVYYFKLNAKIGLVKR